MDVQPDLVINVDETGFGASRSGRLKSTKVIVPCSVEGRIYVGKENEPHYISAICGITPSGRSMPPALVTKRKTIPLDVNNLPIGIETKIYHSEREFVTRRIFQAYLRDVVFQYIEHIRAMIGERPGCDYLGRTQITLRCADREFCRVSQRVFDCASPAQLPPVIGPRQTVFQEGETVLRLLLTQ